MTSQQPAFPCAIVPSSPAECRLLGLYPQRQEGRWMKRVKILGGILTHHQWAALADMCRRFTPSTPLLLTTRQDIEFHNLTTETIPLLQAELAHAGLTGVGACGDTLRNITICPGSGLCHDTPDLTAIAWALRGYLESYAGIYSLPRKFKISFSACTKACAQPWINDLGFVVQRENSAVTVTAIGAGSLGPRPATGILIEKNLAPEDIPALAQAAIRVFDKYGDRQHRAKARLRHVRERCGDERFLELLHEEQREVKREAPPHMPPISVTDLHYSHVADLNIIYGGLTPDQAEAIAALMRDHTVKARLQTHHLVSLFARNAAAARNALQTDPVLKQLADGPDVVSCPGTTYCAHALVNTHAVEKALRLQVPDTKNRAVRISGCPNMCAQSGVADIGLIGRIRKDDAGNRVEGFMVVTGGGMGTTAAMAEKSHDFVPSEKIPELVKNILHKSF
jgi:sulfite reductase beta subunit-like hemoprotein